MNLVTENVYASLRILELTSELRLHALNTRIGTGQMGDAGRTFVPIASEITHAMAQLKDLTDIYVSDSSQFIHSISTQVKDQRIARHSPGNFSVYDSKAKILWSGDIGAALLPDGAQADLFVRDFGKHAEFMRGFHQRWMSSNEAKNNWVDRVSRLEIDMICPQHGSIIQGQDTPRFLTWLRELRVGSATEINRETGA